MKILETLKKIDQTYIDQNFLGFSLSLFGSYHFDTEKLSLGNYEVKFVKSDETENTKKLHCVQLFKNQKLVMQFNLFEGLNYKTLHFEISKNQRFNYVNFCILFKFFYEHVKENTEYENLIIKTSRYKCYWLIKYFGFAMLGHQKKSFYLHFNLIESMQKIWEEFYGSLLEENLYNFLLPIQAGGYVTSNVRLKKSTDSKKIYLYQQTQKKYLRSEQPMGEIKVGYYLHNITVKDLSTTGMSFQIHPSEEKPEKPNIQINHIYTVWIKDDQLNINWTNLSIQIMWQKGNHYGCRILKNNTAWDQFLHSMKIEQNERLTFIDKAA